MSTLNFSHSVVCMLRKEDLAPAFYVLTPLSAVEKRAKNRDGEMPRETNIKKSSQITGGRSSSSDPVSVFNFPQ